MKLAYTITITKTEYVTRKVGKEWERIGGPNEKPEYGYTPEIDKLIEKSTTVLTQTLDDVNVAAVIKAINGL